MSGAIVSSVRVTEEEVESLWVGVQTAVEGRGKNAHIVTLFGDWGPFKSGFSDMEMASSSAIGCCNGLESLRGNRGEVEVRRGEAVSTGEGWTMTCIAKDAEERGI